MASYFNAVYDAELAKVVRVLDTPIVQPNDFGSDLSAWDGIPDPTYPELPPTDPLVVGQAAYRRIITSRGSLSHLGTEWRDYGVSLQDWLHKNMSKAELNNLQSAIRGEILKDDRVDDVTVTVNLSGNVSEPTISVSVLGACATGTFELVVALTDGQALLEKIQGNNF